MTTKARLYPGVMGRSAARRRGRAASAFHVCCSVMVPSPQSQNGSSSSSSTPPSILPHPPPPPPSPRSPLLRSECAGGEKGSDGSWKCWKLLCRAAGMCGGERGRADISGGGRVGVGPGGRPNMPMEGKGRGGWVFFFFFFRRRERAEIETLLGWRAVSSTSTQLLLENSAPCPTKPAGMT